MLDDFRDELIEILNQHQITPTIPLVNSLYGHFLKALRVEQEMYKSMIVSSLQHETISGDVELNPIDTVKSIPFPMDLNVEDLPDEDNHE